VVAFAGADESDPVAFLSTPLGQPGHVPIAVRHDATTEIRLVGASAGVVRVGASGTQAVALGPALDAVVAALATLASTLGSATTIANVAAAGAALTTAIAALPPTKSTRLEAAP
jgi:hypothetical protein